MYWRTCYVADLGVQQPREHNREPILEDEITAGLIGAAGYWASPLHARATESATQTLRER